MEALTCTRFQATIPRGVSTALASLFGIIFRLSAQFVVVFMRRPVRILQITHISLYRVAKNAKTTPKGLSSSADSELLYFKPNTILTRERLDYSEA
jgi:hypothetical protein